jgi:hypothetical protein
MAAEFGMWLRSPRPVRSMVRACQLAENEQTALPAVSIKSLDHRRKYSLAVSDSVGLCVCRGLCAELRECRSSN